MIESTLERTQGKSKETILMGDGRRNIMGDVMLGNVKQSDNTTMAFGGTKLSLSGHAMLPVSCGKRRFTLRCNLVDDCYVNEPSLSWLVLLC